MSIVIYKQIYIYVGLLDMLDFVIETREIYTVYKGDERAPSRDTARVTSTMKVLESVTRKMDVQQLNTNSEHLM